KPVPMCTATGAPHPLAAGALEEYIPEMRPCATYPPIVRLRVRPDHEEPKAVVGRHGPRQPHTDAAFAAVRRLIEQTTLNYQQMAARTGVSTGCISYWKRDGGWKRPPFAPRSNDTMP